MGYNSVLFIVNDAMSEIDDDPEGWWEAAKEALNAINRGQSGEFGFGSHANGFWAVSNRHADETVLIAAGGNYPTALARLRTSHRGHHRIPEQIDLLRQWAAELGFEITPKMVVTPRPSKRPES